MLDWRRVVRVSFTAPRIGPDGQVINRLISAAHMGEASDGSEKIAATPSECVARFEPED